MFRFTNIIMTFGKKVVGENYSSIDDERILILNM
jgi:hypothetical protein